MLELNIYRTEHKFEDIETQKNSNLVYYYVRKEMLLIIEEKKVRFT